MADDNYYQDSPPKDEAPDDSAEDREESDEETALLPKSVFGDKELKVGKECKFKIEHIYEDEIEVSYVPHGTKDKSDDGSGEDESDDDPFSDEKMAAMKG